MRLLYELSNIDRAHINLCGFTHLLQMPDIRVNHGILIALVEWFHPEHNTFHLRFGEMNITLDDIYRILRIPFYGDKVDYDSS